MIPVEAKAPSREPGPLEFLEEALRDGSLARAVEKQRLGDALTETLQALADSALISRLGALVPAAATSASCVRDMDTLTEYLAKVNGVAAALSSAESQEALQELPEKLRFAKAWCDNIERELDASWAQWVGDAFRNPGNLSELLLRFEGTRDAGEQVRDCASEGMALAEVFPPSEEQVSRALELISTLETTLDGLKKNEATGDLLAFLDKVRAETATLSDVTPPLRDWLRENDALTLLKVKLS